MANYANIKATIDANIKQNGNEEITGPVLNSVLNQMLEGSADTDAAELATEGVTVTKTTLDPTSYTLRNYIVQDTGRFGTSANYKHILIPCSPGDVFYVKGSANPAAASRLCWFTSNATPTAGATAPLVAGTTRMTLSDGASGVFVAPAGANYFYIQRGLTASAYPNTPQAVVKYANVYADDIVLVTVAPPCYYDVATQTLHLYYIYLYLQKATSSISLRVNADIVGSGPGAFVLPASRDSVVFRSSLVEGDTTLLRINSAGVAVGGMLLPYINAVRIDTLDAVVVPEKYRGKKLVSTGGSIVYGTGLTNRETENYTHLVAERLGMTYDNYGIPGSTIGKKAGTYDDVFLSLAAWNAAVDGGQVDTSKKYLVKNNASVAYPYRLYTYSGGSWSYSGSGTEVNARTPLVDRMAEMDPDAEVVLIMGGGNDWMYLWDDLGTDADDTNETILGALHKICKYVMNTYPQKLVIWIGLPPAWRYQPAGVSGATWNAVTWDAVNPDGITYADVENAVKMVLKQYGIHFYPIADDLMFSQVDRWWCADTNGSYLHPNAAGHQLIADALVKKIISIR